MIRRIRQIMILGVMLVPGLFGFGAEYENTMFDENNPGYLYSFGKQKYLGIVNENHKNYITTIKNRKEASQFNARIIRDPMESYVVFTSAAPADRKFCSQPYSPHNDSTIKSVLGCPSISIDNANVFLEAFTGEITFKFLISPAIIKNQRAVRIYNGTECLTVQTGGSVGIDQCEYRDIEKKSRQLFIWVSMDHFAQNIHPQFAIHTDYNPASPHYRLRAKY
ncbi:hypothetical protein NEOKW01_1360 [Nematocida sp. AWRm80]|nr:hypothetical protein NEOKW01_1360 [Nematocida sp. AWRm80]